MKAKYYREQQKIWRIEGSKAIIVTRSGFTILERFQGHSVETYGIDCSKEDFDDAAIDVMKMLLDKMSQIPEKPFCVINKLGDLTVDRKLHISDTSFFYSEDHWFGYPENMQLRTKQVALQSIIDFLIKIKTIIS